MCEQGTQQVKEAQLQALAGYISTSPEASEVFALWQEAIDGKPGAHLLVQPVLNLLRLLIENSPKNVAMAIGDKISTSTDVICSYPASLYPFVHFLNSCVHAVRQKSAVIRKYIGSPRPRLTSAALKLLGSVVRLHPKSARMVCSQVNLAFKPLLLAARSVITPRKVSKYVKKTVAKKIAKRKAEKGQELANARPGYISFITGLLSSPAPDIVRTVVFAKGIIHGLVSGLDNDRPEDALATIHSLAVGVARNPRLSRSVRSFVLNHSVLEELLKGFSNRSEEVHVALAVLLHPVVSGKPLPLASDPERQQLIEKHVADQAGGLPTNQMCVISPTPIISRHTPKPTQDAESQQVQETGPSQDRKSSSAFKFLRRLQVRWECDVTLGFRALFQCLQSYRSPRTLFSNGWPWVF